MVQFVFGEPHGADEVLAQMELLRQDDVRWREGRVFSLAYDGGAQLRSLSEEAYRRFSGENALNSVAFPSLRRMQADVVRVVTEWVHGGADAAGYMTSGGTESLILAVRAAKVRAARDGRLSPGCNMVLPTSAHAAFEKAADYFGVESRRIPVRGDWRADVDAMHDAVDDATILVVGSAPQYPQGVIDPIPPLAEISRERDLNMHVDACMGGVVLPYLERTGETIPPWDFRVDGVTSVSVDLHKYGYCAKGAGVLVHRTRSLRNDQTFVTSNWLGGTYGSSGILGTKSGGPIASAWAVMHFLGDDGYRDLAITARETALRIANHVASHPRLTLRAEPDSTLVSFGGHGVDVFAVADELRRHGWWVDRQDPPASVHLTVHAGHRLTADAFLADLDVALTLSTVVGSGSAGNYATLD